MVLRVVSTADKSDLFIDLYKIYNGGPGISVGIATDYGLDG